jgi:hypothetical protein
MEATQEPRSRGRPGGRKVAIPGGRVGLGLTVSPDTKNRLDNAATLSGRNQSQQAEYFIELGARYEAKLGGAKGVIIHEYLADIARVMYGTDCSWTDDYEKYAAVCKAWQKALDDLAPMPPTASEELTAAAREMIAELAATEDPDRAAHLRAVLGVLARSTKFPSPLGEELERTIALPASAESAA